MSCNRHKEGNIKKENQRNVTWQFWRVCGSLSRVSQLAKQTANLALLWVRKTCWKASEKTAMLTMSVVNNGSQILVAYLIKRRLTAHTGLLMLLKWICSCRWITLRNSPCFFRTSSQQRYRRRALSLPDLRPSDTHCACVNLSLSLL